MGTLSYILLYCYYIESVKTHNYKMPKGSGLTKALAVSPELADLVGAKKGENLKEHKLQDPDNKQYFTPDAKMEPIFGKERIRAFGVAKFLKTHLTNVA